MVDHPAMVSFPKSGRTWVRVMLDELGTPMDYTHAGSDHRHAIHCDELGIDIAEYGSRDVIFLARDPRDVAVSGFFQVTKRLRKNQDVTMQELIRDPRHGVKKIVRFYNIWMESRSTPRRFLLLRYEDFLQDCARELARIGEFLGRDWTRSELEECADKYAFNNMQKMERSGAFKDRYGSRLTPTDIDDVDTYKTRRGVHGGYRDYLTDEDLDYCESVLAELHEDLPYGLNGR